MCTNIDIHAHTHTWIGIKNSQPFSKCQTLGQILYTCPILILTKALSSQSLVIPIYGRRHRKVKELVKHMQQASCQGGCHTWGLSLWAWGCSPEPCCPPWATATSVLETNLNCFSCRSLWAPFADKPQVPTDLAVFSRAEFAKLIENKGNKETRRLI